MKKKLYIALMGLLTLSACQEDILENRGGGDGVTIALKSGVPELSTRALTDIVKPLHLLILDQNGKYLQSESYGSLESVTPVRLEAGNYYFAYLSNVEKTQISGLQKDATLDDVKVSVAVTEDGDATLGEVFVGLDTVVAGRDQQSTASLSRLVGRMDITVTGVNKGQKANFVMLNGSPRTVNYWGDPEGSVVAMKTPLTMDNSGQYIGKIIAFPTLSDSIASLTLRISTAEGDLKNYTVNLNSRIEPNKIHRITLNYHPASGGEDPEPDKNNSLSVTSYEIVPWGESVEEDLTVGTGYLNNVQFSLVPEDGANISWKTMMNTELNMKSESGEGQILNFSKSNMTLIKDTASLCYTGIIKPGNYTLEKVVLYDSLGQIIYRADKSQSLIVDGNDVVRISLPALQEVTASEKQAMLDLREALKHMSPGSWSNENIALWDQVEIDTEGHIIGIGQDELKSLEEEENYENRNNEKSLRTLMKENMPDQTWTLPESFKNLSHLKYFTYSKGIVTTLPDYLTQMTALEQLEINMQSGTIPELPNLKYLSVGSDNLSALPSYIGKMKELIYLEIVPVGWYEDSYEEMAARKPSLQAINVDLSQLTQLRYLGLVAAENCAFPDHIWRCTGLKGLALFGFAEINMASVNLPGLTDLTLWNKKLTYNSIRPIVTCPLEYLEIGYCRLEADGTGDFIGEMATLERIFLDSCGITTIPASWDGLINMDYMELTNNSGMTGMLPAGLLERYNAGELSVYSQNCGSFVPDGKWLRVGASTLNIPAEGGRFTVKVESNVEWTVENQVYFASLISGSGVGNGEFEIVVEANDWEYERSGNLYITNGKYGCQVTVLQMGNLK